MVSLFLSFYDYFAFLRCLMYLLHQLKSVNMCLRQTKYNVTIEMSWVQCQFHFHHKLLPAFQENTIKHVSRALSHVLLLLLMENLRNLNLLVKQNNFGLKSTFGGNDKIYVKCIPQFIRSANHSIAKGRLSTYLWCIFVCPLCWKHFIW